MLYVVGHVISLLVLIAWIGSVPLVCCYVQRYLTNNEDWYIMHYGGPHPTTSKQRCCKQ